MNNHERQFQTGIERLARVHSIRDVFTDLLDITLHCFCVADHGSLTRNPLDKYKPEERSQLIELMKLMGDIADADGTGFHDALGDLFMEHLSFGKNGQFFTPQPICDMMAMLQDEPQDGQSVCDCACGSGRTLLAMAKRNRRLVFYGSDIDITCVKMAAVNMLLNSLTAEIAWMDTLSMEHWGSFHCALEPVTRFPYLVTTGKGQTHFIQRLKASAEPEPAASQLTPPAELPTIIINQPLEQLKLF